MSLEKYQNLTQVISTSNDHFDYRPSFSDCASCSSMTSLAQASPFVGQVMSKEPPLFDAFLSSGAYQHPLNLESVALEMRAEVSQQASLDGAKRSLRVWRNRIMAQIALQRLLNTQTIEQEMATLSCFADHLITTAYQWCFKQMTEQWGTPLDSSGNSMGLMILAMGKYGGLELNFSSDVDLIFFYAEEGETQGANRSLEHHTFFIRLGQQLINLLNDTTRDGRVFRVDMRLRPYGESGPLAMSLDAAEDYYQEQGREWERFAMIKARVIGEDSLVHQVFYKMITPFVFRRYIDFGVLESIRSMKSMIANEVRRRKLQDNIKLGSGGIREAEFIVQSLQLIRGGRIPQLRAKSFYQALEALQEHEVIPQDKANTLKQEYSFLRKVEHILQMQYDEQTQQLPDNECDQARLIAVLDFENYTAFYQRLQHALSIVHQEFSEAFRLETDDSEGPSKSNFKVASFDDSELSEVFAEQSSEQVQQIAKSIRLFVASNAYQQLTETGRNRLSSFFPGLLSSISKVNNAQVSLERILQLLKSINRRTAYLVLLEENPPVLEHLVRLCSQSAWISERLTEYPILLDELLYPNALYTPLTSHELKDELRVHMLRVEPDDEEQQQEHLRIFKQTHELRVAAAVLNQTINVRKASRYLSHIAEAVVDTVLYLSWHKLVAKFGAPQSTHSAELTPEQFAIIGYGKFGGEELGFGSDLDIVFLYDADPESKTLGSHPISNAQFFTRLAQRIISSLNMRTISGVLYEVDTRLRPSGNSGLLVSHITAFKDYQESEAWTWEHQALTRARMICGDPSIGKWFSQFRNDIIGRQRDSQQLMRDVVDMRDKMRRNLDKSKDSLIDIKQGVGTMVDIEFIAQYLVLSSAHLTELQSWSTRTTHQLEQAAKLDLISAKTAALLIEAYRYYRECSNYLVLTGQDKCLPEVQLKDHIDQVCNAWSILFKI